MIIPDIRKNYYFCRVIKKLMRMKTFKIISRASGRPCVTWSRGLTLREAQKQLLSMFNVDKETQFNNWGHCRRAFPYVTYTYHDGTRSYEEDGVYYRIEEEEVE